MRWGSRVDEIHVWWERTRRERYWLDATNRNDRDKLLAAPRGNGGGSESWTHRLITHVKDGDVVFHYDAMEQAIIAWSVTQGPIEKKHLSWPLPARFSGDDVSSQVHPSWAIGLRHSTRLEAAVSMGEIARTQWGLFPALRALEDEVGDPLYYPFEMAGQETTRLLPGSIFKLPAVFVQGFPTLARAAERAEQVVGAASAGVLAAERHDRGEAYGPQRGRSSGSFVDTERILQGSG